MPAAPARLPIARNIGIVASSLLVINSVGTDPNSVTAGFQPSRKPVPRKPANAMAKPIGTCSVISANITPRIATPRTIGSMDAPPVISVLPGSRRPPRSGSFAMPGLPGRAARTGYRVLRRLEEDDSLDRHAGNEDRRDHPPPWRLREADGQRRQARARRVQRKGGSFPGEQDDDDHGDRRREKLYPRMPAAPERLAQKADRDGGCAGKPDREKTRHDHGEGVYDHVRRSGNRSAERSAHDDVAHHH